MNERRNKRKKRKEVIRRWQDQKLNQYAKDILESENFRASHQNIQHGKKSVMDHSMDVARMSVWFSHKFGIKCEHKDLIRGALLHDYFLYDWHTKGEGHGLHGFYHPGIALRNASKEYELSDREKDIIKHHMWPLTLIPPMCKEGWIVTSMDKYCSLIETLKRK